MEVAGSDKHSSLPFIFSGHGDIVVFFATNKLECLTLASPYALVSWARPSLNFRLGFRLDTFRGL